MNTSLLLADDSPTIAKILQMSLASEPYEIRSVLTADDAIRELQSSPPVFFLVDLTLPEKNGYEFARLIRSDAKLSKTRVVLLASAFEPVDDAEYAACGADGLVKKPFDPAELRNTLRKLRDAPPKFPDGSKVTGSLSGFTVKPEKTRNTDLNELLSEEKKIEGHGDADSILAGLLGTPAPSPLEPSPQSEPGNPPAFSPPAAAELEPVIDRPEPSNATIKLDLSDQPSFQTQESVLDLSGSFSTPPGGIALAEETSEASEAPPLSANAQALAAFFEAEIQSKDSPPPAPPAAAAPSAPPPVPPAMQDDSFDASLGSIEWTAGPADASLNAWSSSVPKEKPTASPKFISNDSPPPAPQRPPRKEPTRSNINAGTENMLFDTGGSSFRFSEDYINRISKAFTGAEHDHVPESAPAPFFPQESHDRHPVKSAPAEVGGGAWSDADVKRIEKIVREEVQMIVREVAEKIAWEVIPELAENLIRKELDKVLKELGPQ